MTPVELGRSDGPDGRYPDLGAAGVRSEEVLCPRRAFAGRLTHPGLRLVTQQRRQPAALALPYLVCDRIPVLAGVAARQLTAKLDPFAHHVGARPLDTASDDYDRTMSAFRHDSSAVPAWPDAVKRPALT